jgi:hypothetical protein
MVQVHSRNRECAEKEYMPKAKTLLIKQENTTPRPTKVKADS